MSEKLWHAVHAPHCQRPGWTTEPTRVMPGVIIARCQQCGAVQLTKTPEERRNDAN